MSRIVDFFAGVVGVVALAIIVFWAAPDPRKPINEVAPSVLASTNVDEVRSDEAFEDGRVAVGLTICLVLLLVAFRIRG